MYVLISSFPLNVENVEMEGMPATVEREGFFFLSTTDRKFAISGCNAQKKGH